jgi:hypothetical protein
VRARLDVHLGDPDQRALRGEHHLRFRGVGEGLADVGDACVE